MEATNQITCAARASGRRPTAATPSSAQARRAFQRPKRELVNEACSFCRRKKLKCSAARPKCSNCQQRREECIYVTRDSGETRVEASRRRLVHAQARVQMLDELFGLMRAAPHHLAFDIFQQLRVGVDATSLVRQLKAFDASSQLSLVPETYYEYDFPMGSGLPAHLRQAGNPYMISRIYEQSSLAQTDDTVSPAESRLDSLEYRIPYHAVRLIDSRIGRVKAAIWTNVTSDDLLVQELLRVYFVHEYAYIPIFHKDLFLDDMIAGSTEFCSPLLVNAVLAWAWHGRLEIADRAEFWNPSSLGYQFMAEAKRLWELSVGNISLTSVQAALVIWVMTNMNGQDISAWAWMAQVISMGQYLNLFTVPDEDQTAQQRIARTVTAWSIFAWQAQICFHFHRPPLLDEPPQYPLPSEKDASLLFGEVWLTYPGAPAPVPMHHGLTFKAHAQLRVIMNAMAKDWFSKDVPSLIRDAYQRALSYQKRLEAWYTDLSTPVTARHMIFPSALKAHMHYWMLLLYLFEPFKGPSPPSGTLLSPEQKVEVQRILAHSKRSSEMLVRLYYIRHGCQTWDSVVIMFIFGVAANTLQEVSERSVQQTDRAAALQTLILCAKCLADQSANTYLAEATFRGLRNSMTYAQVRRLAGHVQLKDDARREQLITEQLHSDWPVQVTNLHGDPIQEHLGTLVRAMGDASLA